MPEQIKNKSTPTRVLGVFALTTMAIAAILSLRNLPIAAVYGLSAVTYYIAAAILFFIPTALVCTELSTSWPETGGLYMWVKKALGPHFGFLAIWFEWINTVCSFPMMLGFILFTLIYPFTHQLANDKFFEFSFMVVIFWLITFINFLGIKTSSRFSAFGVVVGTLLVAILIIALGILWIANGHPLQISFHAKDLIPSFKFGTLAFLITVINSVSGIQVIAFHARETRHPERNFPRAAYLIVAIILLLSILGALSISIVTPHHSGSLIGGIVESLTTFLGAFHLAWLVPTITVLIAIGVIAEINAWVIGPSKGMLAAAKAGQLPKFYAYTNKRGVPTTILLTQGVIGTLLAAAYIFMPSVNSAYWLLSDLTAEFTMMMWILLFISVIVLRYKQPQTLRPYRIPGGKLGIWLVAGIGALVCIVMLVFSYIPPDDVIRSNNILLYESVLFGGLFLFSILPLIKTLWRKKPSKNSSS